MKRVLDPHFGSKTASEQTPIPVGHACSTCVFNAVNNKKRTNTFCTNYSGLYALFGIDHIQNKLSFSSDVLVRPIGNARNFDILEKTSNLDARKTCIKTRALTTFFYWASVAEAVAFIGNILMFVRSPN